MPWVRAAARGDLAGKEMLGVRLDGHPVAIFALDGGLYATNNNCPHMGALLTHGCVVQGYVECPMHHALFDIRTGEPDGSVTDRRLRTYAVKVEGDTIYVDLPAPEEHTS
ncbi:MAG: non-heme iron oxygenase ferredoxin subunit [Acidobacteria bacterium]|nr:non-heme iron oxygenase ferredoxin subunit [Acidobacteriota bacterium]